jgi:phosphoribosylformylglycinamidine synthase
MNPECAVEEFELFDVRKGPKYLLTFNPDEALKLLRNPVSPWRVAVVREEGVNGDREMIAALMKAKFEVYDVTMSDLLGRRTFLDHVSDFLINFLEASIFRILILFIFSIVE